MIVEEPRVHVGEGRCRIEWPVEIEAAGDPAHRARVLWIELPAEHAPPDPPRSDAALLILLPLAMRLRERMVFRGPVSGELLLNALEAMSVYATYYPGAVEIVPIEAQTVEAARPAGGRRGSFYSGGVDSLFNIAESERLARLHGTARVTDLWLVHGLDVSLEDTALWEEVRARLSHVERVVPGVRIVEVSTNAREVHGRAVDYNDLGFSPILGGLAKCFASEVPVALIGSARTFADIMPHASTPLVDPLWSCGAQTVRHFTARVNRSQKIATIGAIYPELFEHLRVCWKNIGGAYNCGVCEKCLRTQLELELSGYRHLCDSFARPLTLETLGTLKLPLDYRKRNILHFWRDLAASCRAQGKHDYARLLERKLRYAGFVGQMTRSPVLRDAALSVRGRIARGPRRP